MKKTIHGFMFHIEKMEWIEKVFLTWLTENILITFKMIIMKKIIGGLSKIVLGSNNNGILSLIKEKTGKISFKRSAAVMLIVGVVIPDYADVGLTILNVSLAVGCLAAVALPKVFSKDSE